MKFNQRRLKGLILVILGSSLWGISGTVAQYLFQVIHFSVDTLVMLRLVVSGIMILFYLHCIKKVDIFEIWQNTESRNILIAFSVFGMLGVQYSYFAAIKYGNAATATILQYLSPVVIAVFLVVRWRKIPSNRVTAAIGMAMLGTFYIVTSGQIDKLSIDGRAVFWGLMAAVTAAFYTVQPHALLKKYGALLVVGWGMFIGGVLFAVVKQPWQVIPVLNMNGIAAIVFVIFFGTLLGFTLYFESMRYITPTESCVLSSAEPLSAAILSVTWLGNQLYPVQWLGIVLILLTIVLLARENTD